VKGKSVYREKEYLIFKDKIGIVFVLKGQGEIWSVTHQVCNDLASIIHYYKHLARKPWTSQGMMFHFGKLAFQNLG
jgi:lipopolysaccharide biosynthesis glycosyltransferase